MMTTGAARSLGHRRVTHEEAAKGDKGAEDDDLEVLEHGESWKRRECRETLEVSARQSGRMTSATDSRQHSRAMVGGSGGGARCVGREVHGEGRGNWEKDGCLSSSASPC